jgi:transcriptional regulator with XRE-family HTH domain
VVDVIRLGSGYRALRQRRRLTQTQVGSKARVSASVICRIERGHADRVALHVLVGVAAALDARIDVRLLWQGEGLDRLLDARHARLVDLALEILASNAWEVATEVSFNIYGERGSIDILAFHPATGCLLVIEIKSVMPDMQSMLASLDRKGRLASEVASKRGWRVASVSRLLVLPDDRTARRRVDEHAATFRTALPARTIEVRRWLARPSGTIHGVMFMSDLRQAVTRQRIRPAPARSVAPHARHRVEIRPDRDKSAPRDDLTEIA